LRERGASFWPDLVATAHAADLPYDDDSVLESLWDLVWAGEVTNDSLAPVRGLLGPRARRGRTGATPRRARGARVGGLRRPQPGALGRLGPPSAAGRWSLVAPLLEPAPSATEMAHAQALQLLERHGVLTREAVLGEGLEGGFAAVYPVLKALEERGHVRRGYFVAGLGAAQFAAPGAVDRLRASRDPDEHDLAPIVLAATDPAQPFGAALPWPGSSGRPARAAGAHVVLVAGEPVVYLERGGRSLVSFPAASHHPHWAEALVALVKDGRVHKLEISKIDGEAAAESPLADMLRAAGFAEGYRGLTLRG
jgi:ATP-dependent Lhr-like helicase